MVTLSPVAHGERVERNGITRFQDVYPVNSTSVTATLDNRSSAATELTVSASPAGALSFRRWWDENNNILTIPAGQTASTMPVVYLAENDDVFTQARKSVTISATASNPRGVTGPGSVCADHPRRRRADFRGRQHRVHLHRRSRRGPLPAGGGVWQRATDIFHISHPRQWRNLHSRPAGADRGSGDVRRFRPYELHADRHGRPGRHRHHDGHRHGARPPVLRQRRSFRIQRARNSRRLRGAAGVQGRTARRYGELNWSEHRPMEEWEGVHISDGRG